MLGPALRIQTAHRQRRHRRGRRQQQVVGLEQRPHAVPVVDLPSPHGDVVGGAPAPRLLDAGDETGIHPVAPLAEELAVVAGIVRRPQEPDHLGGVGEAGLDLLDLAAERLERARGGGHQRGDVGIDPQAAEVRTEGHALSSHTAVQQAEVVGRRGLERRRVPRIGPGHHAEHQRGVGHGAGHRPGVCRVVVVGDRPDRNAPVGRLDADDAAEGGRNPDRAGAVRALVERTQRRGRCRAGTGAGAAGGERRVPRVARDAGERAVAQRLPAELGRGGLADADRARLAQATNEGRVDVRHPVLEDVRAPHRPHALGQREVLDRHRQAVQRAERRAPHHRLLGVARGRQRGVGRDGAERVQRRIEPLDALERGPRQLDRRELLRADEPGQLGGRGERQVGGAHESRKPLPWSARRASSGAGVQNASPVAFWNSSILSRRALSPF